MRIELLIHLEPVPEQEEPYLVWWGESDEVPGFSVAADHLPQLLQRAREALHAEVDTDIDLVPVFASEPPDLAEEPAGEATSGMEMARRLVPSAA